MLDTTKRIVNDNVRRQYINIGSVSSYNKLSRNAVLRSKQFLQKFTTPQYSDEVSSFLLILDKAPKA